MKLNLLAILLCLHFFSFATEPTQDYTAATDEQLESIDDTPFAPPQSRASNVEIGQGQNKCRAFTGSTGSNPGLMDTRVLYSGPTYDKLLRLTQYQTIQLNAIEKWTIVNNNIFGHSFHVHDVQFKIIARSSGTVGDH